MSIDQVANFIKVQAVTGYSHTATSITLVAGQGATLPDPAVGGAYNMVWWNVTDYADPTDDPNKQIIRVTAKAGDVLTITQGQEGTTAVDMNIAAKTYQLILTLTKKTIDDIRNALISGVKTVSATYSITSADSLVIGNTASGSFTVTLPSAVTYLGKVFMIKKGATAYVLTIATTSSQTIDGATTAILRTKNETLHLVSDGSNWIVTQSKAGQVQVGHIVSWHGSFTGTPALGEEYVECNGQVLSDASSIYNGQPIPDLNGAVSGLPTFIRGATASGSFGGSDSHYHNVSGTTDTAGNHSHSVTISGSGCYSSAFSACGTTDSESSDTTVDAGNLNNMTVASACHTHTYNFGGSVNIDFSGISFSGGTDNSGDHAHSFTTTTDTQNNVPYFFNAIQTMRIK